MIFIANDDGLHSWDGQICHTIKCSYNGWNLLSSSFKPEGSILKEEDWNERLFRVLDFIKNFPKTLHRIRVPLRLVTICSSFPHMSDNMYTYYLVTESQKKDLLTMCDVLKITAVED